MNTSPKRRSDHVTGTSDAPIGRTPVHRATAQRSGCSVISAVTNRGQVVFRVYPGTFRAPMCADVRRCAPMCADVRRCAPM
ncbi:MAG: hypothetical protein IT199_07115 [Solirubrobacterales bacterium]|nr:hypothetical protein [Solirubrobacterales bacterium]